MSYVKPKEKILPLSHGLGQGKLTTLRCENRKIRHETKFKKDNEWLHMV
jgi:hypothetical protein